MSTNVATTQASPTFTWTDDNVEKLILLSQQNSEAVKIAEILGTTKNAVCGKVHRLRSLGILPKAEPRAAKSGEVVVKFPKRKEVTLHNISNDECRFPVSVNDANQHIMCGAKVYAEGKPYCARHYKEAHYQIPAAISLKIRDLLGKAAHTPSFEIYEAILANKHLHYEVVIRQFLEKKVG